MAVDCANHPGTPAQVLAPRMRQHPDFPADTAFEIVYQPLCQDDYFASDAIANVNTNIIKGWDPQPIWLVGSDPTVHDPNADNPAP